MIRKTISMPDAMGDYIEDRVKSGQYGNDSEYIRDLVRRDQERAEANEKFRIMVDEASASGVSDRTVEEIFQAAVERYEKRQRRA
ncbi:MAG: type II toxin-antitoxin system ParD family antitoxin [Alphaproteobacteria bacterium]|nr:type II toxin-antitoxin system ParD family antitoxin [Alphaproteobacteria bacterium]